MLYFNVTRVDVSNSLAGRDKRVDQLPDDSSITGSEYLLLEDSSTATYGKASVDAVASGATTVVHKTGNETIAGTKTFSSSPHVPAPSGTADATTKAYVDAVAAAGVGDGDKGDVVVSGTGTAWALDSGVVTPTARTLLDDSSVAAMRTTLGVGDDTLAMHLAGTETVTGAKTFNAGALLDKGNLVFNVKAYGALGDGVTNDKTTILNTINAAGAAGGGIVYFPPGTYLINSSIRCIYGSITLAGAGRGFTTLLLGYAQTNGGAGMIYFNHTDGTTTTNNITVRDLSINMNSFANNAIQIEAPTTGTGVSKHHLFQNVEIYGRGPDDSGNSGAIKLRGVYNGTNGTISDVAFDHVEIRDGAATDATHRTGWSVFIESNNIEHCRFEHCYFHDVYSDTIVFSTNQAATAVRARKDISFDHCSFINTQRLYWSQALSDIKDTAADGFDGIRISACLFRPSAAFTALNPPSGPDSYALQIYNSNKFVVDHCIFDGCRSVIASGAVLFGVDRASVGWTFSNNVVWNVMRFSDPDSHYGGIYSSNVFYRLRTSLGVGYSRHYPTSYQNNLFYNCLLVPEDVTHEYTQAIVNVSDGGNVLVNNVFFNEQQQSTPTAPTVATGAAGVLTGTYLYKVTFVVKDLGETAGGITSASVSPSSQKVELANIPLGGSGVTSRRIYRTLAGGADGSQILVAELDVQQRQTTTTYSDNIADGTTGVTLEGAALGTPVPTTNTTTSAVKYIFAELGTGASVYNPNVYRGNTIFGQGASTATFWIDSDYAHVITGNTGVTESTIQNLVAHGTPSVTALPSTDIANNNWKADGSRVIENRDLGIADGGTGQSTASTAFNALSPLTVAGDMLYGGSAGAGTRLPAGTTSQVLTGGTAPAWGSVALASMVSGQLPIANGGTGSASKNFVDLTTTQTVAGAKTFSNVVTSPAAGYQVIDNNTLTLDDQTTYRRLQSFNGIPLAINPAGNEVVVYGTATLKANSFSVANKNIAFSGSNVFTNTNDHLYLQTDAAKDIVFRPNVSEKMRITTSTGYVGMGLGGSAANSVLQLGGPIATAIVDKTAAYTLTATDSTVTASGAGATFALTLPTAVGCTGRQYTLKRKNATNNITVATTSAQTIDGAASKSLDSAYAFITVQSDNANWVIVATGGTIT